MHLIWYYISAIFYLPGFVFLLGVLPHGGLNALLGYNSKRERIQRRYLSNVVYKSSSLFTNFLDKLQIFDSGNNIKYINLIGVLIKLTCKNTQNFF